MRLSIPDSSKLGLRNKGAIIRGSYNMGSRRVRGLDFFNLLVVIIYIYIYIYILFLICDNYLLMAQTRI